LNKQETRNALSLEMMDDMVMGIQEARLDDGVRVVIITGAGSAFSAGGDVKRIASGEIQKLSPSQTRNNWRNGSPLCQYE
jgi:enoyl-CoA hydratase/carnithine racemase